MKKIIEEKLKEIEKEITNAVVTSTWVEGEIDMPWSVRELYVQKWILKDILEKYDKIYGEYE